MSKGRRRGDDTVADFQFRIHVDNSGGDESAVLQALALIEAVVAINMDFLRRNPDAMTALACGCIKYDRKNKNITLRIGDIFSLPIMIRRGWALCIDIVAAEVAIRRLSGQQAWALITHGDREGVFHVMVEVQEGDRLVQYDPATELDLTGKVEETGLIRCPTSHF